MDKYYRYSQHLKKIYGVKTYKLPVNLPLTCPNRDGYISEGGCAFCGESGAAFEYSSLPLSVKEQLLRIKSHIAERYGAEKFIAYFQNFTNTYLPLDDLKKYISKALEIDDIVEIALSTRPDCVSKLYFKELSNLIKKTNHEVNLSLELGLQTVNYHNLKDINRGHTLAEFIDAILIARNYNIKTGAHLILNLPGDNLIDVKENAKILSALKVDNVKLHALYIRENTIFGNKYKKGKLEIISLEKYIKWVITFLEYLNPEIAVQRLLGRAPEEKTLFVNWGYGWREIQNMILDKMEEKNSYQGKKFNYLDGKALKKFSR